MARNASGTYSLPSGNPVVSGATITTTWANTTMADIAAEITGSLSRSGQGGMTAAIKLADGSITLPGMSFVTETSLGFRRVGAANMALSMGSADIIDVAATIAKFGMSGATYVISQAVADQSLSVSGSNAANDGAELVLYGGSHATLANDLKILSDGNALLEWDESAGELVISSGVGSKTAAITIDSDQDVTFSGSVVAANIGDSNVQLNTKVMNLGDWDMQTDSSLDIAHGLDFTTIRSVSALIRADSGAPGTGTGLYTMFPGPSANATSSELIRVTETNIELHRASSGTFDQTAYNDGTSWNRGWVTILYTD